MYQREIALAKALSTPILEEAMSVKDKAAPVSTEPVRPRSSEGTGPRGAPLKVIREREQIPADHISPGNTLTQESR